MTKTALITGGASGLGAAVAEAVRKEGYQPYVLDRAEPAVGIPHKIVDLADSEASTQAVKAAIAESGGLDAVITCAGIDVCGALTEVSLADWTRVIAVNLIGTAAVIKAALPQLRERRGHVVTVASTLGLRALPDATAYCASKFGVVGFSRALAAELAGDVGVTLLIPGGMSTNFFADRPEQYRPPADAELNAAADVAEAVVFAISRPPNCQVRELVVTPAREPSWP